MRKMRRENKKLFGKILVLPLSCLCLKTCPVSNVSKGILLAIVVVLAFNSCQNFM
jgi:hypothetical protein